MKLRRTADGLIVSDRAGGWVSLPAAAGLVGAGGDALFQADGGFALPILKTGCMAH